jgi:hypothetical protein
MITTPGPHTFIKNCQKPMMITTTALGIHNCILEARGESHHENLGKLNSYAIMHMIGGTYVIF